MSLRDLSTTLLSLCRAAVLCALPVVLAACGAPPEEEEENLVISATCLRGTLVCASTASACPSGTYTCGTLKKVANCAGGEGRYCLPGPTTSAYICGGSCPTNYYASKSLATATRTCELEGGSQTYCVPLPRSGTTYYTCGTECLPTSDASKFVVMTASTRSSPTCAAKEHMGQQRTCKEVSAGNVLGAADVTMCNDRCAVGKNCPAPCPPFYYAKASTSNSTYCDVQGGYATTCTPAKVATITVCGTSCPTGDGPVAGVPLYSGILGTDVTTSSACISQNGHARQCTNLVQTTKLVCGTDSTAPVCPEGTYSFGSRLNYSDCSDGKARFCKPVPASGSFTSVCGTSCPTGTYSTSSKVTENDVCRADSGHSQNCSVISTNTAATRTALMCGTSCPPNFFLSAITHEDANCPSQVGEKVTCKRPGTNPPSTEGLSICGVSGTASQTTCPAGWYAYSDSSTATTCDGRPVVTCRAILNASSIRVCGTSCPMGYMAPGSPITSSGCPASGKLAIDCTKL